MTATALRAALDAALTGVDRRAVTAAVTRMVEGYRSADLDRTPRLASAVDVAAYAAYRMPATYAAVRSVLARLPPLSATSLVDLGGGTGAAAWAVADVVPTVRTITVTDRSAATLDFGRRLARTSPSAALRTATWEHAGVGAGPPTAELVTASYLLGELDEPTRAALVGALAAGPGMVLLVEPGTPAGYRRILAARDQLVAAGHRVVAPCPHSGGCPLAAGQDWCHFMTRLDRSALHRQVKGGDLGYEDEKFAYVVTAREGSAAADGRVLRHPRWRKGLVELTVCRGDGTVAGVAVGRSRPTYRAARDTGWGDPWPPPVAS